LSIKKKNSETEEAQRMEFDETMAQHDTQWHGKARQIPDGRAVTICSLAVLSSAGTKWR
jgi:hypothetical protein